MLEAIKELSKQVSLEDTIKATILWQTLNTSTPTIEEMETKGLFLQNCIKKVHHRGITMDHWHMVEAAADWEMGQNFQGLGGCEAKPLVIKETHGNNTSGY